MAEKSAKRTLADQRILLAYGDVGMLPSNTRILYISTATSALTEAGGLLAAATVHEWKALDFLAGVTSDACDAAYHGV